MQKAGNTSLLLRKCKRFVEGILTSNVQKSVLGLNTATVTFIPNPPTEIIGKKVKVKFMVKDLKRKEWFFG